MDNPAMQGMMMQLMQDPEVMQMLQDPEMKSNLQRLMQGDMSVMSNPRMMPFMAKVQALMSGGGMGGSSGSGSDGSSGGGNVSIAEVRTKTMFDELLASCGQQGGESKTGLPPVLIADFFLTTCGPCIRIAPEYQKLANEYKDKATFVKINGRSSNLAQQYRVTAFPTFIFFVNGREADRLTGARLDALKNLCAYFIDNKPLGGGRGKSTSQSQSSQPQEQSLVVPGSEYKHFPLSSAGSSSYAKTKFSAVLSQLQTTQGKLMAELAQESQPSASSLLGNEDQGKVRSLISALDGRETKELGEEARSAMPSVRKLLGAEGESITAAAPALHLLRHMCVVQQTQTVVGELLRRGFKAQKTTPSKNDDEPTEEDIYGEGVEESSSSSSKDTGDQESKEDRTVVQQLVRVLSHEDANAVTAVLTLRIFVNILSVPTLCAQLLCDGKLAEVLAACAIGNWEAAGLGGESESYAEALLNAVGELVDEKLPKDGYDKKGLMCDVLCKLFVNFSTALRDFQSLVQQQSNGNKFLLQGSDDYFGALKVQLISSLQAIFAQASESAPGSPKLQTGVTLYPLLVAAGTICYGDAGTTGTAADLGMEETLTELEGMLKKRNDDPNAGKALAVLRELLSLLSKASGEE